MDSDEELSAYDEFEAELIARFDNGSITRQYIESIPPHMWRSLPLVTAAVRHSGAFYGHVPPSLRDNREWMLARVRERGTDLQYASDRLRADPDIFGEAVMQAGTPALRYVDESLRGNARLHELASMADDYRVHRWRELNEKGLQPGENGWASYQDNT